MAKEIGNFFSGENIQDALGGGAWWLFSQALDAAGLGGLADVFQDFGVPAMQAGEQQRATEEAREENKKRYWQALVRTLELQESGGEVLGELGESLTSGIGELGAQTQEELRDLRDQLMGQVEQAGKLGLGELGTLRDETLRDLRANLATDLSEFSEFADPMMQAVRDREARLLAELEGAGAQERIDINQAFDVSGRNELALLAARGFGGSTIGSSVAAGTQRDRTAEVARLEERLRGERFERGERLSADTLAMQEALGLSEFEIGRLGRDELSAMAQLFGGMEMDMLGGGRRDLIDLWDRFGSAGIDVGQATGQAQLATEEQFGLMGLDFDTMNTNRLVDIILGRTDLPPSENFYLSAMEQSGGASAELPDDPGGQGWLPWASIAANFIPVVGSALSTGLAGYSAASAGGGKGGGGGGRPLDRPFQSISQY